MSRLSNWIDRPSQEQETDLDILYDKAQTVDVYRRIETGSNTGFGDEVDNPLPLRSINARLDKASDSSLKKPIILGLTDDTDVRINDRWRVSGDKTSFYTLVVKQVEYRRNTAEVLLERE